MKEEEFKDLLKSEVSKRNFLSSMITGSDDFFYFRPNNYRRQITIRVLSDSIGKSAIAKIFTTGKVHKHSQLLYIKNYANNITIQLGKNKLTAIWSQNIIGGEKEVYKVDKDNLNNFLSVKKEEIKVYMDKVLADFCVRFRYDSVSDPVWSRYEDWIRGESYVESIPEEVIIHDALFKKVYRKGIEAIGGLGDEPTERIRRYIHNRMVEDDDKIIKAAIKLIDEVLLMPLSKQIAFWDGINDPLIK